MRGLLFLKAFREKGCPFPLTAETDISRDRLLIIRALEFYRHDLNNDICCHGCPDLDNLLRELNRTDKLIKTLKS